MITKLIDEYIKEQRNDHTPSESIYATDLGQCLRKTTLRRAGFKQDPFGSRTLRIFKVGNMFHDFVMDIMEKKGVLVAKEVEAKKDNISGRADMVVKGEEGNILYEIKTVHSRKFFHLKNDTDKHYLMQASIYYHILKDAYTLTSARLLYISKDDLCTTEMLVPVKIWVPKALLYIADLNTAWEKWRKEGILPNLLPDVENKKGEKVRPWQCKYCNFRSVCKEER